MTSTCSDQAILDGAREVIAAAKKRRGIELCWPDERLPNDYRANPSTAWGGRGTDTDYEALESSLQWIVDAFQYAIPPDPEGFNQLRDGMAQVVTDLRGGVPLEVVGYAKSSGGKFQTQAKPLNREQESLDIQRLAGDVGTTLSAWHGWAADNFKTEFINKVPIIVTNQADVALSLQTAAEGCRLVYESARAQLLLIAKTTRNVLNFKDDTVSPDLDIPLSVTAGALSIAAATGIGTAGVLVLTTIGAAVGSYKDVRSKQRDQAEKQNEKKSPDERAIDGLHIGGATTEKILQRMYEAIKSVEKGVSEAEDTIIQAIENNIDLMAARRTNDGKITGGKDRDGRIGNMFLSPRPSFIQHTASPAAMKNLRKDGMFTSPSDTRRGLE